MNVFSVVRFVLPICCSVAFSLYAVYSVIIGYAYELKGAKDSSYKERPTRFLFEISLFTLMAIKNLTMPFTSLYINTRKRNTHTHAHV